MLLCCSVTELNYKALGLIPSGVGVGCPKGEKETKKKKQEGIFMSEKSRRLGTLLGMFLPLQYWTTEAKRSRAGPAWATEQEALKEKRREERRRWEMGREQGGGRREGKGMED